MNDWNAFCKGYIVALCAVSFVALILGRFTFISALGAAVIVWWMEVRK